MCTTISNLLNIFTSLIQELFSETLLLNEGSKKCNFHYSAEEQQKLLKKINESSSDDLQRYVAQFSIAYRLLLDLCKLNFKMIGLIILHKFISEVTLHYWPLTKALSNQILNQILQSTVAKVIYLLLAHCEPQFSIAPHGCFNIRPIRIQHSFLILIYFCSFLL